MTIKTSDRGTLCACAATPVVLVDGKPARRIQLLPMGKFAAAGWGEFEVKDKADAERIIAATRAHLGSTELMGDYDHQLLYAIGKDKGGQAVASAWVDPASLVVEDTGIWADVAWTPLAEQRLVAREYRYISPLFLADGPTVKRLHNFALVNTPAIKELAAAASEVHEESPDMKTIAAALGLSETATEAEITAAIVALNSKADTALQLTAAAEALGLAKDATGEQIVAAATALKAAGEPDPTKFAPMSMVEDLQKQLGEVVAASAKDKAQEAVDAAIAAGKIQPAHRDHWIKNAAADPAGFDKYVAAATVIVPMGERLAAGAAGEDVVALSDEDKALCVQMGWDQAEFLETRKQEKA